MNERLLAQWVMRNLRHGTRWQWKPPAGQAAVVVVIHGYQHNKRNGRFEYELTFGRFFVEAEPGNYREVHQGGDIGLPEWFRDALRPHSTRVPHVMWSSAFKERFDRGIIVPA